MIDAQNVNHFHLSGIIQNLKDNQFVIPDFQREFEWNPSDVRELLRSIFLDYYIGSPLLWKSKEENFATLSCVPIYGQDKTKIDARYIVLDGQQRLTAIYYASVAPEFAFPGRQKRVLFYIRIDKFMQEDYESAFTYLSLSAGQKNVFKNKKEQYEGHYFPISALGEIWGPASWIADYIKHWERQVFVSGGNARDSASESVKRNVENAYKFQEILSNITQKYQITAMVLDQDLEIEKICDIFTRINTRGQRLDIFDLMNAMLKPSGVQLRKMWQSVEPKLSSVLETRKMNIHILQVMSMTRQIYCSPKYLYNLVPPHSNNKVLSNGQNNKSNIIRSDKEFIKLWDDSVQACLGTLNTLTKPQSYGVLSAHYLPYVSIIPVFAALQEFSKTCDVNEMYLVNSKIRTWYWVSVFQKRYSGSTESTGARDYIAIREWISNGDSYEPPFITDFWNDLNKIDLRNESKRGTSVYNGMVNFFVCQGIRDFRTGETPIYSELQEFNIVPNSWIVKIPNKEVSNSILNRTLVSSQLGIKKNEMPNVYFKRLFDNFDNSVAKEILRSHLISSKAYNILLRQDFNVSDYLEFISERQKYIFTILKSFINSAEVEINEDFEQFDKEKIKGAELLLRKIIDKVLDGSLNEIPEKITQRLNQTKVKDLNKNILIDNQEFSELRALLEYSNISDLKKIITCDQLWSKFSSIFLDKVSVMLRLDQLSEIRNPNAHHRKINKVTQKDGEAALMWIDNIAQVIDEKL